MKKGGSERRSVSLQRWRIEVYLIFGFAVRMWLQMHVVTRIAVERTVAVEAE